MRKRSLVTILAGIVTHSVVFTYLADRTTCAARVSATARGPDLGKCVMRVLPDFDPTESRMVLRITWDSDTWPVTFLPGYVIAGAAGLLVGVILWGLWARRSRRLTYVR